MALAAGVAAGGGCAPAPAREAVGGPVAETRRIEGLDPARSGSLTQEQISVRLTAGALRIEVESPLLACACTIEAAAATDTLRDRVLQAACRISARTSSMARRAGVPGQSS